jgi:two-component system, NarL family, sensor kinase
MAIRIEKSFQVQAPLETVWQLLSDPRKVAGCIPGAQVTEALEGGVYKGVIKVKVGPSVTDYKGEARIGRLDQEAHEIEMTGKGQNVLGQGSASMKMTGKARTLPEGGTKVVTITEVNVVGPLAQLGARMIQELANQLFAEFVRSFRHQLQQEQVYAELFDENSDRRKVEDALRTSEQRLQDIIDHTTAVIFVKDLELRYLLINQEYERRHRVGREEILGQSDFDIHPREVAEALRANDLLVIETGEPSQFEEVVPSVDGTRVYLAVKFLLRDRAGKPYAVCGIATDITGLKRAEEMQIAVAREREMLMRQRAADLAKANEALRCCLDALASVPELDAFIGQVMVAITRQLGAVSSNLRVLSVDQKGMRIELLFQDGSVISPGDAGYPERFQSLSLEELGFASLQEPYTVLNLAGPQALEMPADLRAYLHGLGVRTLLVMPLLSQGHVNGILTFRFAEERDFQAEELEIARALAIQASLAIHLTGLAKSAKQSAVLEERNRLAGEIHDSLAQSFTGISMQLEMAKEVMTDKDDELVGYVTRANDLARFGLAEARRSVVALKPMVIKDSALIESLQMIVERSNITGRLRCTFRSNLEDEESLPAAVRQDLLRIAQEAISNALRHAKSTAISVNLRSDPPNLILKVKDNGCGMTTEAETREGFGFANMRARVKKLKGTLDIRTLPGRGTTIIVRVPLNAA